MCTLHANSAREALVKMCTLPLLAGENISAPVRGADGRRVGRPGRAPRHRPHGVRRVSEIVAVPGRVENDVIETETVFVRRGRASCVRTGGMPPRLERFERVGIDVHSILRIADQARLGSLMGASSGSASASG